MRGKIRARLQQTPADEIEELLFEGNGRVKGVAGHWKRGHLLE